MKRWRFEYTPERWQKVLTSSVDDDADVERLRLATLCGRPFCAPEMLAEIEEIVDRSLVPKAGGRPKKEQMCTRSAAQSENR